MGNMCADIQVPVRLCKGPEGGMSTSHRKTSSVADESKWGKVGVNHRVSKFVLSTSSENPRGASILPEEEAVNKQIACKL